MKEYNKLVRDKIPEIINNDNRVAVTRILDNEEYLKELTLQGNIVLSVGLFGHSGDSEVWENMDEGTLTKTKEMLDDMHKRKIDMADEIYVINVGGYVGDSTKSEINYAKQTGKKVNYLENID